MKDDEARVFNYDKNIIWRREKNEERIEIMSNIIDFENEKLIKNIRKIYDDFKELSDEDIMIKTYKKNLYHNVCGQSKDYYHGWINGVEYMMEYIGIDYMKLRQEVKDEIERDGRDIVNAHWFDELGKTDK